MLIDMLDNHISRHKDHANKFDTGAMVAKNFAIALLDKEQDQLKNAWTNCDYDSAEKYYNETYGNE